MAVSRTRSAIGRLRGWREDGRGEFLRLAQAGWQGNSAHLAGSLVILPAGADQVTAHYRFDGQGLEAPRHHAAAFHLRTLGGIGQHCGQRAIEQVVRDDVSGSGEPEIRDAVEDAALAGNRVRQDYVKGGQAVGGHDEQAVRIDGVDIAHLAAVYPLQGGKPGFVH
jgi:hypothetical protein